MSATTTRTGRALTVVIAAALLLSSCTAVEPPADGQSVPAEPTPAVTNELNGFEGELGLDWARIASPLDEITPLNTIEAAAGRLWVLANTNEQIADTFVTRTGRDRLLVSNDGVEWSEVDLDALGIPREINGGAVMTGDHERVVVVFSASNGVFGPDGPQPRPWVLVGDLDDWRVFGPDELGEWSVTATGSGRFNVGSMLDVALVGDTVIAAAEGSWPGSGRSVTLIVATLALDLSTGQAVLRADRTAPFGDDDLHTISNLVSHEGAAYAFGHSTTGSGIALTVWRTTDGITWSEQRPNAAELAPFVTVVDAAVGPPGLVVVAEVDADGIGADGSVALSSSDGQQWNLVDLGSAWDAEAVFWSGDSFVVAGTARPEHPVDEFEATWVSSDGLEWTMLERSARLAFVLEVVEIPGGLIGVREDRLTGTGVLPPFATLVG